MLPRLLALTALLVGATAALADEAEDRAVAVVNKLRGKLTRGDKATGKPVIGVNLSATRVTDADLQELVALKKLRKLDLSASAVTGAGLKNLAPLTALQELNLGGTHVRDADLKELAPPPGAKGFESVLQRGD